MADEKTMEKPVAFNTRAVGIDPARGGCVMLISGTLLRLSEMIDKKKDPETGKITGTGEITLMAEIEFRGGTHFQVYEPGHPISNVQEDSEILLAVKQKKGKKGWYNSGLFEVLQVNGKAFS